MNTDSKNISSYYDDFSKEINHIKAYTVEQQMSSGEEIQENLSNANNNISDANRLKELFSSAEELQQAANLGLANLQINMEQYKQIVKNMQKKCHQQQVATDMQVISAMQKAILAMAQAQNALIQSQSVDKIFDSITKCQDSLTQIENQN